MWGARLHASGKMLLIHAFPAPHCIAFDGNARKGWAEKTLLTPKMKTTSGSLPTTLNISPKT